MTEPEYVHYEGPVCPACRDAWDVYDDYPTFKCDHKSCLYILDEAMPWCDNCNAPWAEVCYSGPDDVSLYLVNHPRHRHKIEFIFYPTDPDPSAYCLTCKEFVKIQFLHPGWLKKECPVVIE